MRLLPIIKEIPKRYQGCRIGIINVGKQENRSLVQLSSSTNTPIKYVPYMILYVNNKPLMRYDDSHSVDAIIEFIKKIAHEIQQKQVFSSETEDDQGPRALCGEFGCCYVTTDQLF